MDFKLNFSKLFADDLQKNKISHSEITHVYEGDAQHTAWEPVSMQDPAIYYYLIGFSNKHRFLQILLHCDGIEIYFLQVKVADDIVVIIQDFFKKL